VTVKYDRDKACDYARRFWDKPCNDQFLVLDRKPNPKFQDTPFVPAARLTRFDAGSNLVNPNGGFLIDGKYTSDAAHFVSCCIGEPAGEHAGGLAVGGWDRSGKKPYGDQLVADLVRRLAADKRIETLLDESKDRSPPDEIERGDIVAYWDKSLQKFTDIALYVGEGRIVGHSPSRGPSSGASADWDYPHDHADMRWTVLHVRTAKGKGAGAGTAKLKTYPFKVFTLLEHYWADPKRDDEAWNIQQAVPLDPGKMNPGFWDGTKVKTDQDFRDKVWGALPPDEFKTMRYAVAQIGPGSSVRYGGNHRTDTHPEEKYKSSERRDLESWEAVSCGKLALLYAAYQLRFDVLVMAARNRRESVKKSGPKRWETPDELFEGVVAEWSQRQVLDKKAERVQVRERDPRIDVQGPTVFRDGKPIPLTIQRGRQRIPAGPPRLKEIFDAAYDPDDGWSIRFLGEPKEKGRDARNRRFWAPAELKAFEDELRGDEAGWAKPLHDERTFFQLLWLTIVASHDHGATLVIDKLGYLYVNSLLWQSGLFDAARGGGMWIARNYGGGDLKNDYQSEYRPNEVEFWDMSGRNTRGLLVPVSRKTPDGDVIQASLSAASGTAYMVLLEQNRLVNAPACLRMKVLLDRFLEPPRDPHGQQDDSPLASAVLAHPSDPYSTVFKHVHSKIGIGGKRAGGTRNFSDCALLVTKNGVTYAATCLDSYDEDPLNKLGKAIFDAVGG
jgi:hypothetical protein